LSPFAVALIHQALTLQTPPDDGSEVHWLFPARAKRNGRKDPILPGATAAAMHRGRGDLGVDHFCIHDLRCTAATQMAEMGINPHTISLILNHVSASRSTVTSRVYIRHSYDKEKREALEARGARLEKIVSGTDAANVVTLAARFG
jgi:integrase